MKSRMKIENPGAVEITLTVTMRAERWEKIRDWLKESKAMHYEPEKQFASAIDDLLGQVRKLLWHDEGEEDAAA